ncbi:extracellular solute-binding protein [Paenibacillus thalictri]|uniref:Extracellular solute-binding protein n=1 Tax=Paenibacillus thalictri TaxID=2527873 RepID=A0A4Q9DIT9_9BACL|nr:extracellular solute-binding protein [Paenibacillus thalictri]TBL70734.1 extracellular solute-binding protein [Paenibacillus thalictri]
MGQRSISAGHWAAITLFACAAILPACTSAPAGSGSGIAGDTGKSADTAKNLNITGLPIVKERISLKMVAAQSPLHGEWKDKLLWTEAEKRTGVHIDWELIPQANLEEKKNLLLASGTYPDAFYGGGISTQDLINYGEQGVFIPLNDLIDKYAPNFKKVAQAHPEIIKGLTAPDGKIYSLPKISINPTHLLGTKLYINQKWLDALGLQMPKTTDELYQVLKAFKEKDPNKNGQADEIPISNDITGVYRSIAGAYGLNNRGQSHPYVDYDENAKKLRFIPMDPKYKEVMEYLRKLYAEGLIDPEIFTNTVPILTAKITKDQVGAFPSINTVPAGQKRVDFKGIPQALKGPHGDQLWVGIAPSLQFHGAFVITKANKNPEATMRWADYFIDGDGAVLYWMGVEGKTYEMKDGKYRFVQDIVNNPNGLTLDQAISRDLVAPFTNHPIVREERFAWDTGEGLPEVIEAGKNLQPYVPKEVWPAFLYTQKENERMLALSNDIDKYVKEMQTQFITGKAPISKWDDYVATLKKMGLDEYMSIYLAAYERYSKNK